MSEHYILPNTPLLEGEDAKNLLTRESFHAWLFEQDLNRKFVRCAAGDCPIAEYLNDTYGKDKSSASHIELIVEGVGHIWTPRWATKFMSLFDGCSDAPSDTANALRCMRVLDAIDAGEEVAAEDDSQQIIVDTLKGKI